MEFIAITYPLLGGILIGLAVTLMLFFNGRVTGISGIISATLSKPKKEDAWRWMFLAGMLLGGIVIRILRPDLLVNISDRNSILVILAGLFVGYGTVMGSGCTSGHGVCGISRFSIRSILATVTFMFFGFLAVQFVRHILGGTI